MIGDLPAELCGGPNDGDVLYVRPGSDGLPCDTVEMAIISLSLDELDERTQISELTATYAVYRRAEINDDTHRWRYAFDPRSLGR